MIIYGWGRQIRKDYGAIFSHNCSHCNNDVVWHVVRVGTWATLFFIPIFPYQWKYYLMCPTCESAVELQETNKIQLYKKIAELVQNNADGLVSDELFVQQYNKLLGLENEAISNDGLIENTETESELEEPMKQTDILFCTYCGSEKFSKHKFCGVCGKDATSYNSIN